MNRSEAAPNGQPKSASAGDPEIAREIRTIIAQRCGMSVEAVTPDLSLENGLGVDSLALIEINVALEERFQIVAPDFAAPDQAQIHTVGDVIAFVEAQLAARGGAGAVQRGAP
ncbi:acyl carrier protein [Sorangium sp. So ce131]|uniref:acyl carrier protein n=1 Tax=Sorangium sp. So ce131 TaxID=3133282 RepID=UPI003F645AC5